MSEGFKKEQQQQQQQQQEFEIVRRADSYEVIEGVTVTLSDEFEAFDFEEFATRAVEAAQEAARQTAHRRLIIRLACVGAFSALVIALAVVLIRKLHKAGKC